jgi:pyrroline-5-carboxylate reductase
MMKGLFLTHTSFNADSGLNPEQLGPEQGLRTSQVDGRGVQSDGYKVGFIGIGNMGFALLEAVLGSGKIDAADVFVTSRSESPANAARELGVQVLGDVKQVCQSSDIVFIGVKPKDVPSVLKGCKGELANKALVSMAAGLTYADLSTYLPGTTRVLTILPNTPISVGAGVVGLTSETTFTDDELQFLKSLLESGAELIEVPEKLLGVLSAVSGSGPAFLALFIEALADGAVKGGIPRATAYRLAAATAQGTGKLLLDTGKPPAQVKDEVCSPGGTSIAGVAKLEEAGVRGGALDAVKATIDKWYATPG